MYWNTVLDWHSKNRLLNKVSCISFAMITMILSWEEFQISIHQPESVSQKPNLDACLAWLPWLPMGLSIQFESPALSGRCFAVFAVASISGHVFVRLFVTRKVRGGGGADPNSLIYSNTVKYYHMNIICSLSSRIRAGFGANIYENDIEESGWGHTNATRSYESLKHSESLRFQSEPESKQAVIKWTS